MWYGASGHCQRSMWKVVGALTLSSSVLSFPWPQQPTLSIHKDPSTTTTTVKTWTKPTTVDQTRSWYHSIKPHSFLGRHLSVTRCEAVPASTSMMEYPYEKMPLPERGFQEGHAIFGVLLGENMIESYDVYRRIEGSNSTDSTDNVVVAHVKLGTKMNGHPGVVHGGILSLIFDDVLGYGFEALGIKMAFTANLSVDYRAPVPAGTMILVQAQLEQWEGRKLYWKAQMTSMDNETLFAECSSLYIIPRSHAD